MNITAALEAGKRQIGEEVGVSDWLQVTQSRIDIFAAATLDMQWIHTEPERAAETAFGGTIAHGFLTLSLAGHFAQSCLPQDDGAVMGINYGFDKIRFLTPVREGAWLRGRFTLLAVAQRNPQELLRTHQLIIDIKDVETPALVGTWLGLTVFDAD
ncbi:MaoC family dehydratase [Loktanella agnita]|uniref:MaoC family dehydratase n=1 Tax=Loktanella agnita TaxID=287097 RepID=UPI0039876E30